MGRDTKKLKITVVKALWAKPAFLHSLGGLGPLSQDWDFKVFAT